MSFIYHCIIHKDEKFRRKKSVKSLNSNSINTIVKKKKMIDNGCVNEWFRNCFI